MSVWLVIALVLFASVVVYALYRTQAAGSTSCTSGPHTLNVWTYDGLFGSGNAPNTTRATIFGGFQNETQSTVCVTYISGDLESALALAKPSERPDVVIGLDELEAPEADALGLLVPYTSPELSHVPADLIADLAPDHSATPYEYGYLGLDYNLSFDAANGQAFSQGDFFRAMTTSSTLAGALYYPDPVVGDITGEEFLAWEVEYYTNVLHENWTTFWTNVAPYVHPVPDWTTGWNEFSAGQAPAFLSYTTDPATEVYYGAGGWMNSTVAHDDGRNYSWQTVYGTSIVDGAKNLTLAQRFVDWMLSGTVQNLVAENEWEYPANDTVALPSVFSANLPPSEITPLNAYTTPSQSSQELKQWVLELSGIVG